MGAGDSSPLAWCFHSSSSAPKGQEVGPDPEGPAQGIVPRWITSHWKQEWDREEARATEFAPPPA